MFKNLNKIIYKNNLINKNNFKINNRFYCTINNNNNYNNDQFKKFNEIEESFDFKLPPYQPIIIRLDGSSFSTLTKKLNLNLPHDQRFQESMKQVAVALGNHFKGTQLIYTFSDEINLLIWNHFPDSQIYSNRLQKLNSISSSIASVTFSNSLLKQLKQDNNNNEINEINSYFDSRAFIIPENDIGEYFLKRYKRCYSNCLTSIISYNDKNKEYQELKKENENSNSRHSLYNREKFIQNNLNIKLSQYPEHFRNGILFYKNQKSNWEIESFPITLTFINNIVNN